MPLRRRIPKRGFHNPFRQTSVVVNLGQLEIFDSGIEVTPELLLERRLIRRKGKPIKILADGSLTKPLTVKAHAFSSKAKEKLEALGGRAELISEGATKEAVGK